MAVADYDECWLRYREVEDPDRRRSYATRCRHVYVPAESAELGVVREELRRGLGGLLGRDPHLWQHPPRSVDGFLAIGQRHEMPIVRDAVDAAELDDCHDEGFVLRSTEWGGRDCLVLTSPTDRGLVYGTFHLLRRLAARRPIDDLDVVEEPATDVRVVNHWDRPFKRSVERGYAGASIFDWERLPDLRPRYADYARLLASLGLNGVVVNNVNTQTPGRPGENAAVAEMDGWRLLESENLEKVAALASVFRRHGQRTYLAVDFAAPMLVGDLDTADPLDADVRAWWAHRCDEIYDRIPDFGGFLVKADSEGQPGPHAYGRDHAEGANLLAEALAPHGGRVFWRAFVYEDHDDRAAQAYETFAPLDGAFADNVTLQVKNGPVDFQPREPPSTLFGAMPETDLACELQLTQEYTGQGVHCTYHVPHWREVLSSDAGAPDGDSSVWRAFDGEDEGLAGVANVGEDPSWTGHYLAQANLYGFGRLAWDPEADVETLTESWARQTFGQDPDVVETVTEILLESHEANVDYTTGGLGLIHMMYNGEDVVENHYDPSPAEWPGYHGASADGVGVDRCSSGSGYAGQYDDVVAQRFESPARCPEELLLFFHHLPWDHELEDGTTVIQRLYDNCFAGVDATERFRDRWATLADAVDERRHRHVAARLDEQVAHASHWRDVLVSFFYDRSGIPDEHGRVPLEDPPR